jgi:sugar lactone lactonase YvrE
MIIQTNAVKISDLAPNGIFFELPSWVSILPYGDRLVPAKENMVTSGGVDPAGRVWCATGGKNKGGHNLGRLFCFDQDKNPIHVTEAGSFIHLNGIAWTADKMFCSVDNGAVVAMNYDAKTGKVSAPRTFIDKPQDGSVFGGMTVDVSGNLLVAVNGSRAGVDIYSADGAKIGSLDVPAHHATDIAFGGGNLKTLFIKTNVGICSVECAVPGVAVPAINVRETPVRSVQPLVLPSSYLVGVHS